MAIDDPFDAIDKQYATEESVGLEAASFATGVLAAFGVPAAGPLAALFGFIGNCNPKAREERAFAFIRQLISNQEAHKEDLSQIRTDINELRSAMMVAINVDVDTFNDAKRDHYIRLIGNATFCPTRVRDVVSFIHDLEQLGERDIVGLKVLNRVMNKSGDWNSGQAIINAGRQSLHPNLFIQRSQELTLQMVQALRGTSMPPGDEYNREEGLHICLRLQGFGLAQYIATESRQVPYSNYCARPTPRGLMLLRLLGEDVPNWERYFDNNGPL